MRRERHADVHSIRGQLLLDLGCVPVPGHPVRGHVLVDRHEMRGVGRRPARPRDARLGVHDYVLDQPRSGQRPQREQRRRGIAAGIGDEAGLADPFAIALGQAVDGIVQQLRRRMPAVPQLVGGRIVQPEVRTEIDYAHVPCP